VNFLRKKTTAFITLEAPDFLAETRKLWGDLLFALEGHPISQVTLRLYDSGDLSLRTLSVVVSLGLKLRTQNIALELEASPRLAQMLRRLNMSSAFTRLTEVA